MDHLTLTINRVHVPVLDKHVHTDTRTENVKPVVTSVHFREVMVTISGGAPKH